MNDYVLLGASGALGRAVEAEMRKHGMHFSIVTRSLDDVGRGAIYWDYRSPLPSEIKGAKVVINCARGPNFNLNVIAAKRLVTSVDASCRLILIGSNCIFARPQGLLARFLFWGDAYICEKKKIERLARSRSNVQVIRPTIVTDEGGWASFIDRVREVKAVYIPAAGVTSKLKVISTSAVAKTIVEAARRAQVDEIAEELFTDIVSLPHFLSRRVSPSLSDNSFEEGRLKNIATIFFCSWLVPFSLKAKVQEAIKEGSNNGEKDKNHDIILSGMTRLYLCGEQTKLP